MSAPALLVPLLLFAVIPPPVRAASLDVVPEAARTGSHGLRVTVGSSCTSPENLDLTGEDVTGPATYEACGSISASATTVGGTSRVVFRAGERIALGDGFRVDAGARFAAEIQASLSRGGHLVDDSPGGIPHYAAGFHVRPDGLTLAAGEELDLLTGRDDHDSIWFRLGLKRNASLGEYRLVLHARTDSGTEVTTAESLEVVLTTGWSWISIDWRAADQGMNDGHLRLFVDGVAASDLSRLDNDQGRIERSGFGAGGVDVGTSGTLDLDSFTSRRAGPIAPPL